MVSERRSSPSDPARACVWVRGEHDLATSSELSATLAREIDADALDLVVDLSQVEFMDASTVGVLVVARNTLRARSRDLSVGAPSRCARRVLDLCDLAWLIEAEAPGPDGPASALGTWVRVPATTRQEVAPEPEPAAPEPAQPPAAPSRPRP